MLQMNPRRNSTTTMMINPIAEVPRPRMMSSPAVCRLEWLVEVIGGVGGAGEEDMNHERFADGAPWQRVPVVRFAEHPFCAKGVLSWN